MMDFRPEGGSFRDPSGQVFRKDGRIFRTVNASIAREFESVERSGLLSELIEKHWAIDYGKVSPADFDFEGEPPAAVLEHPRIPMISYPYEWPFSALKTAALFHLDVHLTALEKGITLSDATAYNVQFIGTRPVFIDPLSFVPYREGEIWRGHKQFCEQFLNPLLLKAFFGVDHNAWYRGALEGIPIDDLAALLPWWRKLAPRTFMHVTAQSALQRRARRNASHASGPSAKSVRLPKSSLEGMLRGLRKWISGLSPAGRARSVWESYSQETSYTTEETRKKREAVADFVRVARPTQVWDLGCNTGDYLVAALNAGADYAVGFDFDQGALERGLAGAAAQGLPILFLSLDAANPSPDQGWNQFEHQGLKARSDADVVLALALIHHLVIARNVPMDYFLDWVVGLAPSGLIEFVPKQDPMVQRLLRNRDDIFPDYTRGAFSEALSKHARISHISEVSESGRCIFGFERK